MRSAHAASAPGRYAGRVPSLEDLALLVAAADEPNFGAVAGREHVSQSTVSRAVQRVEAALGVELFERTPRSVRLRVEAAPRVDGMRSMVATWAQLRASTDAPRTMRIFCTVTASQTFAADLLARFRRAHPDVEVGLRTGPASDALEAARSGAVDAAIAPLPSRLPAGMASVTLTSTPLVAITARTAKAPPAAWNGARVVLPRTGLTRELADRWRRGLAVVVQEADSHEEVVALTALGSGIGIVPALVADSSALRPRLRHLVPPRVLPSMRIGLCARRSSLAPGPLADLWALVEG
jgi:LysR family positive regulator for ilvC